MGERVWSEAWGREVHDLLRGLAGGFLVGIPLLYTMETWWIGETIAMPRALVFLAVAYAVNLALVSYAGFHRNQPGSFHQFTDALEATALAIVASAVSLVLLHQIQASDPLDVIVGRIAVNAVPISFGVSIANHILGGGNADDGEEDGNGQGNGNDAPTQDAVRATLLDIGASFAGALFLSLNIAPTEEIPKLATEVPAFHLPALVLFSLALTYAIVFEAKFGGRDRRRRTPGICQRPITETVLSYVTSLVAAALILWLFGQVGLGTDWFLIYAQVVLLGVPAAIGAAAGRLAV